MVVLGSIDRFWGNSRYLPSQLRFQRERLAQRASYLVLPGFAPLLRRTRPVVAPAPLRCTVGPVAAHERPGVPLCVPLSSHLQLLCLAYQWAVADFWYPGILERESLAGDHVAHLWESRGAAAGHPGDQAMGSSPQAAALVGHRQRHRLGSRVPTRRTVSGKSLMAWVNTVPTGGNMAGCRNHLGHHRCHHGCGTCLGRTCSCEGSVMRRAARSPLCRVALLVPFLNHQWSMALVKIRHAWIGEAPGSLPSTWTQTWSAPASKCAWSFASTSSMFPQATSASTRRLLPPAANSSSVKP